MEKRTNPLNERQLQTTFGVIIIFFKTKKKKTDMKLNSHFSRRRNF